MNKINEYYMIALKILFKQNAKEGTLTVFNIQSKIAFCSQGSM